METKRKTPAQLRAERLSELLGYPPLTVEGWKKDHLRFCHKKGKKRKSKTEAPVTYKQAVEGGRTKDDQLSKRMLHIKDGSGTKLIRFLKYIRGWVDTKTGERKALIEVMYFGERITREVTLA